MAQVAAALSSLLGNITILAPETGRKPTGYAESKADKRKLLAESGAAVAAGLRSWAKATNHPEVLPDVKWTYSDLAKGRDNVCSARCAGILTHAQANSAAVAASYGVDAADIALFATRLADFNTIAPKPKNVRGQRKTKNAEFDAMFTSLRALLRDADDLVETQRIKNPAFYSDYRNARRTDNLHGPGGSTPPPTPMP